MSLKEGNPREGIIKEIKPVNTRMGNVDLIIVKGEEVDGWYPLTSHDFQAGDSVVVTPITRYEKSGGSLTTFQVTHKEPQP